MLKRIDPTKTKAWKELEEHFSEIFPLHMKSMFAEDADRAKRFSLSTENLYLDYSKNRISDKTIKLLVNLAQQVDLKDGIENMFEGKKINETENRAVLHTALRNKLEQPVVVDGENVMPKVYQVLSQMKNFVDTLENGTWEGYQGHRITDVVNIGIGGSDLGIMMVVEALRPYWREGINMQFVSNVDASHISETLKNLKPETTLFIVASKSFTTIETMTNAQTARAWFLESASENDIKNHFVAVSTNTKLVSAFGIDTQNMFEFWDWVGGRFSLSSAVGISIMTAIGYSAFRQLLDGMCQMDQHFRSAPFDQNMPVILGLLGIWYNNFFKAESEAILPYDQFLQYFPAYLQQASMESNGKSINRNGELVHYQTGSIIWGASGTNGQHSFYQLIHQGTRLIPCDFILPVNPHHNHKNHHQILIANGLAQTEALMQGKTREEVDAELAWSSLDKETKNRLAPFKVFEGNHPSNTLLLQKVSPFSLGQLIALYEHKIFVQGYIWNIFSFDQWGVQLGKVLADRILPELAGEAKPDLHDSSTNTLIQRFKNWQEL